MELNIKSAIVCARKLIHLMSEAGIELSHSRLQSLLYYMQAYHLVILDMPLFDDKIEAWEYGAIIPNLYHLLSKYGNQIITLKIIDMEIIKLLEEGETIKKDK